MELLNAVGHSVGSHLPRCKAGARARQRSAQDLPHLSGCTAANTTQGPTNSGKLRHISKLMHLAGQGRYTSHARAGAAVGQARHHVCLGARSINAAMVQAEQDVENGVEVDAELLDGREDVRRLERQFELQAPEDADEHSVGVDELLGEWDELATQASEVYSSTQDIPQLTSQVQQAWQTSESIRETERKAEASRRQARERKKCAQISHQGLDVITAFSFCALLGGVQAVAAMPGAKSALALQLCTCSCCCA